MLSVNQLGLLIFLSLTGSVLTRSMNFTKIITSFNPKYVSNLTTVVDNGSLNINVITKLPLESGLRCNIGVQIKIDNSEKYQTLFSYDYDVCKMLNELFRESLMRTWFRNVLKYSNLMENCPMPPDHYYIRNFRMESNSIPAYLITGEYRIVAFTYFGTRKTKSVDMMCRFRTDFKIY